MKRPPETHRRPASPAGPCSSIVLVIRIESGERSGDRFTVDAHEDIPPDDRIWRPEFAGEVGWAESPDGIDGHATRPMHSSRLGAAAPPQRVHWRQPDAEVELTSQPTTEASRRTDHTAPGDVNSAAPPTAAHDHGRDPTTDPPISPDRGRRRRRRFCRCRHREVVDPTDVRGGATGGHPRGDVNSADPLRQRREHSPPNDAHLRHARPTVSAFHRRCRRGHGHPRRLVDRQCDQQRRTSRANARRGNSRPPRHSSHRLAEIGSLRRRTHP